MFPPFDSIRELATASWKLLLSFRSGQWKFHDYPIAIRHVGPSPSQEEKATRFVPYRFSARILGWGLFGVGDTPENAVQDLSAAYEAAAEVRRRECKPMPRPGTTVPIEFASDKMVGVHPELRDDFVRRVLELEWAWISDRSTLWDFHTGTSNHQLFEKIRDIYNVDVSDIESGNLVEILDRIASTPGER